MDLSQITDIGGMSAWDQVFGQSGAMYATDGYGNVYTTDGAGNYNLVGTLAQIANYGLSAPTQSLATVDTSGFSMATLAQLAAGLSALEVNQINIARAAKNLPLIPTASLAPVANVGLSADTTKMIMYIALGLGAVMLIGQGKKK
jgi:hypothetical protein